MEREPTQLVQVLVQALPPEWAWPEGVVSFAARPCVWLTLQQLARVKEPERETRCLQLKEPVQKLRLLKQKPPRRPRSWPVEEEPLDLRRPHAPELGSAAVAAPAALVCESHAHDAHDVLDVSPRPKLLSRSHVLLVDEPREPSVWL